MQFLTCSNVAEHVGVSTNCIWRWSRKGVQTATGGRVYLRYLKAGRKPLYRMSDLEAFFEAAGEVRRDPDRPLPRVARDPGREYRIAEAKRYLVEQGVLEPPAE